MLITVRDYAYSCANRTLMRNGEECTGPGWAKCLACAGRHYGRPKGWIAAIGVLGSRPLVSRRILRTVPDGWRVLKTILREWRRRGGQQRRHRPRPGRGEGSSSL
jgi:hypothetical protein